MSLNLNEFTSVFSNDTIIEINIKTGNLYKGCIFKYSSKIDEKYLGYDVTWCEIKDNVLQVLIEE